MRRRLEHDGLTVNAIAGTYVVFFGMDLAENRRTGFRGFGLKRTDHQEGETIWMRGMKTFLETEQYPAPGETFSTREHPVQGFQWADYSAKPGRDYTYSLVALYGDPKSLQPRIEIEIPITTEVETGPVHSAFFNRGSVATQEYARRFQNQPPSKAGPGAYEWLSRGLVEALIAFLTRAGKGWEIYGAVYEFQSRVVMDAIRTAADQGAKVHLLFDDIPKHDKEGNPEGPWHKNRQAIDDAGIGEFCKGRTKGKLMHNKFFVLKKDKRPVAVWTGSTNLTENGIFGHSNVGQIVEDEQIAGAFWDYWKRLKNDPGIDAAYRTSNESATPAPPQPWNATTTAVFSPRGTHLDALNWYADIANKAEDALFMTFAFGMHKLFKTVYRKADGVLRMALMEKEGNNYKTREQDAKDILEIRRLPNVLVALGNRIVTNSFDRWLAEMSRLNPHVHVYWIHTKYMLVDPLSATPIVVAGSANFSKASTDTNDENMLVIRGDKRIADIFFGEYMRLYTHYAFRESVKRYMERKKASPVEEEWKPQFLINDDRWMQPYFDPHDPAARYARRAYFAGPMAE